MRNALFQARQFAFWMGIVLLFRILLHIPDAEGVLPVNQLELFSSAMDMFLYGLMIIYASFLMVHWPQKSLRLKETLILVILSAAALILLHLLTWRYAGCDPDVYWKNGPLWFKIIYLFAYLQISVLFAFICIRLPRGLSARWWALGNSMICLPFILFLALLGPIWPFINESFGFMLLKDMGMDMTLIGFYWALSNIPKQMDKHPEMVID